MGFLGALKDAVSGLTGNAPGRNQKLAEEWARLARAARDPEARNRYTQAATALWTDHENKAQRLHDEAQFIEGAYVEPPKKSRAPKLNSYAQAAGVTTPILGGGSPADSDAYREAYQAALAASQGNIEAQYGAALSEISKREGMANQAVDTLPGQYDAIYQPAQAATDQASNAIYQAQQSSGLTPLLPAGAEAAPIQAALSGALASNQAGVPLLRLGVGGEVSKMRQDVEMQRAQAMADLASQRTDYEMNLQEMLLQHSFDQTQEQEDLPAWGLNEINVDRGGQTAKFNPERANAIRSGSDPKAFNAFAKVLEDLKRNPPVGKSGKIKQALVMAKLKEYQRRWPHQAEAISLAMFDSGITGQIEA